VGIDVGFDVDGGEYLRPFDGGKYTWPLLLSPACTIGTCNPKMNTRSTMVFIMVDYKACWLDDWKVPVIKMGGEKALF
jgi:hypothetical protein